MPGKLDQFAVFRSRYITHILQRKCARICHFYDFQTLKIKKISQDSSTPNLNYAYECTPAQQKSWLRLCRSGRSSQAVINNCHVQKKTSKTHKWQKNAEIKKVSSNASNFLQYTARSDDMRHLRDVMRCRTTLANDSAMIDHVTN